VTHCLDTVGRNSEARRLSISIQVPGLGPPRYCKKVLSCGECDRSDQLVLGDTFSARTHALPQVLPADRPSNRAAARALSQLLVRSSKENCTSIIKKGERTPAAKPANKAFQRPKGIDSMNAITVDKTARNANAAGIVTSNSYSYAHVRHNHFQPRCSRIYSFR
jgi:hypothetical protein